jgi:hypothetical protein
MSREENKKRETDREKERKKERAELIPLFCTSSNGVDIRRGLPLKSLLSEQSLPLSMATID